MSCSLTSATKSEPICTTCPGFPAPGCVGMPAHWGHRAGNWRRARRAGGVQYNDLTPDDAQLVDRASGNAWFNGIPVRLAPATAEQDVADGAGTSISAELEGAS